MSTDLTIQTEVADPDSTNKIASLLRWVGISTFALSTILFLLQGLDQVDSALRNWTYLILMVTVGAFGIGIQKLLQDAKSARLLLGAGVALIPVQFAQLAGLVHDAFGQPGSSWLASTGPLDISMLLVGGIASLALAIPVAYVGFCVLARKHAASLTVAVLTTASMLVMPWREGPIAIGIFSLIGTATFYFDRQFRKGSNVSTTLEGRSVRLLLFIPAAIVAARLGFYVDTLQGLAVFGGILATTLIAVSHVYLQAGRAREIALFLGTILGMLAWTTWSLNTYAPTYIVQIIFTTLSFAAIGISYLSAKPIAYRNIGVVLFVLSMATFVFNTNAIGQPVTALLAGLAMCTLGFTQKWREPVIAGFVVTFGATIALLLQAVNGVDFNSWLGLALAGIMLVIAAAVLERHGRNLYAITKHKWLELRAW